jgi:hypothetical protein
MLNEKIHDSYSLCIALAYQSGDAGNQALASYPTACFALRALQGFALPWLMSFNARQQFFFQQSLALPEPLFEERECSNFFGARFGVVCHDGTYQLWEWNKAKTAFVPLMLSSHK